jgi:hypothetical protein
MSSYAFADVQTSDEMLGTIVQSIGEEGRPQVLLRTIQLDNSLGTTRDIYLHKATTLDPKGETHCL